MVNMQKFQNARQYFVLKILLKVISCIINIARTLHSQCYPELDQLSFVLDPSPHGDFVCTSCYYDNFLMYK